MNKRIVAVLLSQLALALPAQTTHRIKGADLQKTIRSAKAGDIIYITDQQGGVLGNLAVDKPLYIHGNGTSLFLFCSSVTISSVPRGASLAFTGFRDVPTVQVIGCAGRVLLSDLKVRNTFAHSSFVWNCFDVAISGCSLGSLGIMNSRVTIENSQMEGHMFNPRYAFTPGSSGLYATNSLVTIVGSRVVGGYHKILLAAVNSSQSWMWAHGSQFQNRSYSGTAHAVEGTGSLLHDPSVTFSSANARKVDPRITTTVRKLPVLAMPQTPLGAQATATLRAGAGSPFVLFFGVPGDRVKVSGIGSALEVAQPIIVQSGAMPKSGATQFSFHVPAIPNLRGLLFRWQGIVLQGTVADWSNSVTECHN